MEGAGINCLFYLNNLAIAGIFPQETGRELMVNLCWGNLSIICRLYVWHHPWPEGSKDGAKKITAKINTLGLNPAGAKSVPGTALMEFMLYLA